MISKYKFLNWKGILFLNLVETSARNFKRSSVSNEVARRLNYYLASTRKIVCKKSSNYPKSLMIGSSVTVVPVSC